MDSRILTKRAFSLLEISIALSVMIVLLLILLPAGRGIISKAQAAQNENNLKAVGLACRQYYQRFNQWPQQVRDLQPFFLGVGIDTEGYILIRQQHKLQIFLRNFYTTVIKPPG